MSQPYECSIATNAEAETLNDKIDAFTGKQVFFYGDVETLIDYVIKDNGNIIAGIRSCFYLGKCLAISE
jgi:hypothetical protein